jgi:hypothetical protein
VTPFLSAVTHWPHPPPQPDPLLLLPLLLLLLRSQAIQNIASVLIFQVEPGGGRVLFRDYAEGDRSPAATAAFLLLLLLLAGSAKHCIGPETWHRQGFVQGLCRG